MTLRLRLLLALVGLVATGLLIADAATYFSLRSFLLDRVEEQLLAARQPVYAALTRGDMPGRGERSSALLPLGTFAQLRAGDGSIISSVRVGYGSGAGDEPTLPTRLHVAGDGSPSSFTAPGGDSNRRFRVLAQLASATDGSILIVAIPLNDVDQTLGRLVTIEVIVTAAIIIGLGALSWWLVRRELRPLDDMAAAAGRIAAGDLSERVEPANPSTEVGRLSLALNGMLEHIEYAFAERTASEERLRRFLADASHELRTPLTSIRGYAEMFHRGASERPEDLDLVMRRIEEEGRRMGVMVDELLLLARLGEGREPERTTVDLARVLGDAVADARATDPERAIELETPEHLFVLGDELQIRQVAANLLNNAQRHTPVGTPITVSATTANDHAEFVVADEGPGMPPEVAARIFEPFYRADPARARTTGGAGLGLAIVEAIVRGHGGEVSVYSKLGVGTRFTVHLPAVPAIVSRPPLLPPSVDDA